MKNSQFLEYYIFIPYILLSSLFATLLPINLGINSLYVSVFFKSISILFSFAVLFKNFKNLVHKDKKYLMILILFFWGFYLIKTIYSYYFYDFDEKVIHWYYKIYLWILLGVLPTLALLSIDYTHFDWKRLTKVIFLFYFGFVLLNFAVGFPIDRFGRSMGITTLYPVAFGNVGATLAMLSFFYFFKEKPGPNYIYYIIAFILGNAVIYFSGSRNPVLSLTILMLLILLLFKKYKFLLALILVGLISLIPIYYLGMHYEGYKHHPAFFYRLHQAIFEGNSADRDVLYKNSLLLFIEKPIFGHRILFKDGFYPHNNFVEIAMSMGVVGLVVYFLYLIKITSKIKSVIRNYSKYQAQVIIVLLFLHNFIYILTSGAIYTNLDFWYFSALILGMSVLKRNNYEET